jgi:hypothetical protein
LFTPAKTQIPAVRKNNQAIKTLWESLPVLRLNQTVLQRFRDRWIGEPAHRVLRGRYSVRPSTHETMRSTEPSMKIGMAVISKYIRFASGDGMLELSLTVYSIFHESFIPPAISLILQLTL